MTHLLDLRGPEFLSFYVPYGAAVFLLIFLLRWQWGRSQEAPAGGRWSSGVYPAEADAPAIALLRGGPEEVARTLLGRLVAEGFLVIEGTSVRSPGEAPRDRFRLSPLEQEALSAAEPGSGARDARAALSRVTRTIAPHLAPVRLELEAAGLAPGPGQRFRYQLLGLAALVLVTGLGAAKLVVAISRGRGNVGFLVILLVVSLLVSLSLMKPPPRTAAGRRYLAWLRHSHKELRAMVIDGRRSEVGELALAAGIFGIAALPALQPLRTALIPPKARSGGGDGGSSCSSGGGCGGGGGGGCGGCGG